MTENSKISAPELFERLRCEENGMIRKQREVARKLGIGESAFSEILNGKRRISEKNLQKICAFLKVSRSSVDVQVTKQPKDPINKNDLEVVIAALDQFGGSLPLKAVIQLLEARVRVRYSLPQS